MFIVALLQIYVCTCKCFQFENNVYSLKTYNDHTHTYTHNTHTHTSWKPRLVFSLTPTMRSYGLREGNHKTENDGESHSIYKIFNMRNSMVNSVTLEVAWMAIEWVIPPVVTPGSFIVISATEIKWKVLRTLVGFKYALFSHQSLLQLTGKPRLSISSLFLKAY